MKKLSFILPVMVALIFAGCQQSQEKQTTEISRKDRLVGNENLNLRNELKKCQDEIEKQKKLVSQCEDEKEKADEQCNNSTKWLLDELPKELLEDSAKLSEENANQLARIADLQSELQKYKTGKQQPLQQPAEANRP